MGAAGKYSHRIELQERSGNLDPAGQPLDDWTEVITVWAQIDDRRGRELVESRQVVINETTVLLRVRRRLDVTPDMRVLEQCHARRQFRVTSVRYDDARLKGGPETLIEAEELIAAGVNA